VALKMDSLDTGELADSRSVELDHLGEKGRVGDEVLDGIAGRGCMCRSPLVPAGPVDLEVVLHLNMMPQAPVREPCGTQPAAFCRDLRPDLCISLSARAPADSNVAKVGARPLLPCEGSNEPCTRPMV